MMDGVLLYVNPKQGEGKKIVVPGHLKTKIMEENHRGPVGAHFSGN